MTSQARDGVAMFVLNDMRLDSRVRREAAALTAAGYDVTVYAVMSEATSHLPWEEVDGYTIVRVPMLMRPSAETLPPSPARSTSRTRRALAGAFVATRPLFGGALHYTANWGLRWHLWARRVLSQVVPAGVWHAHDFNTLGLAVACADRYGGNVVYDSHEIFTEAGATRALPAVAKAIIRRRERAWARRASAVLTVNDSVAEVLATSLERDDVTVVRNCALPPASAASPLRQSVGVGADTPLVLYHGSVTAGRGLEQLIAAFEAPRLASVHLVVMGYGPLRPRLERRASLAADSGRIHFIPPVTPDAVTTWVAGADVAAMPIEADTLNHRLSSPNKLFEAIAAGVPVVGPDFVEFRRVVNDRHRGPLGRLHADHRPDSIADAIHSVLALPAAARAVLRARCSQVAAERWSWEFEARRLIATYRRLGAVRSGHAASPAERIGFDDDREAERSTAMG